MDASTMRWSETTIERKDERKEREEHENDELAMLHINQSHIVE